MYPEAAEGYTAQAQSKPESAGRGPWPDQPNTFGRAAFGPRGAPGAAATLPLMPVLVTEAPTSLGRAVVARLLRAGGEVRVYVDAEAHDDAEAFRRAGVKVARGKLADEGRLELALEQVHTLVHAGGGLLEDPEVLLDGLASAVSAAIGAGCRRVVWASQLAADSPGDNAYLQACAEGEQLLADAPMETVVIRRALTYGPGDELTAALASGVAGVNGSARHAPLYVDDLAGAVVAADAERGHPGAIHLVVDLAGPEVLTMAEFRAALGAPRGVRAALHRGGDLPTDVVDVLSRDQLPGPGTLGRTGTPVAAGVGRLPGADAGRA